MKLKDFNLRVVFTVFMLGAFVGAAACAVWNSPQKITEAPAAAERQADGSLVLERKPTSPKAKPVHAVPKGSKAERVVRVDVQPERTDCPLCTVDLTLIRMPDDTRRVVASSPTGTILGGLDVPIAPLAIVKDRPWAIGGSYATAADSWGVWLDRDFGPLRTGIAAHKVGTDKDGDDKYEARVKLGLRF